MALIPSEQKFHTLDKDTPTKDRGSKQAQALRKIYTMSDISSTAAGSIGVPTDIQYDTVAVMQAATPDVGKYATTLGYTTPGDGGGALYIIAAADPGGTNHTIALANGTFAVSQFSELFVPQQWGVVSGDNSASAASANVAGLNAMFAHMQDVANSGADFSGSAATFLGGDYYVDATIELPKNEQSIFPIYFNGAVLKSTVNDIVIIKRSYVTSSESGTVNIYDLTVSGLGTTGCEGLFIHGSYASIVQGCHFTNLAVGLHLEFALMTNVTSSRWTSCLRGATVRNTQGGPSFSGQSNSTSFRSCRWNSPAAGDYGLWVYNCSQVTVHDSVFEGAHPTLADVSFDGIDSTSVGGGIYGCHVESQDNATSGENIFLRLRAMDEFQCLNIYQSYPSVATGSGIGRTMVQLESGACNYSASWYGGFGQVKFENNGGYIYFPDALLNKKIPAYGIIWTGSVGEPETAYINYGLASETSIGKGSATRVGNSGYSFNTFNDGGGFKDKFTGDATQQSSTPATLFDPTASFTGGAGPTTNVSVGDRVVNKQTGAFAYVLTVVSTTELTLSANIMPASPAQPYTISSEHAYEGAVGFSGSYLMASSSIGGFQRSLNILGRIPLALDTSSNLFFTNDNVQVGDSVQEKKQSPVYRDNFLQIYNPNVTGKYYYTLPAVEGTASQVASQAPIMVFSKEAAPSAYNSPGAKGEIRTDANYIYVCYETNNWRKSATTAW
tara:strand:+ start:1527 stop:3704 length:2178 start_codon:yes stop_codon:yes gene_type:complete